MHSRYKLFADHYCNNNRHGTKAALAAGYAPATAGIRAAQLLAIQEVKDYIEKKLAARYERNRIKIDEAISILTDIGRVTQKDLLDEDGEFIPIHLLPDHVAHAIEEVEYTTAYEWDELTEQRVPIQVIKKIKLGGKRSAIDMALKHLGGYKIDNEQKRIAPIQLTLNPLSGPAAIGEGTIIEMPQPAK